MLNTIRLKILMVAAALLSVFAVATGFSTYLNKEVVEEMEAIAEYHIPLANRVSSIDVLTFEFELGLRRAIAAASLDPKRVAALRERHAQIVRTIRGDIKAVHRSLEAGMADARNDLEDRIVMAELKGSFTSFEQRFEPFIQTGDDTLAAIQAGDLPRARALVAGFGAYEDQFGKDIATVRLALGKLTLQSLTETKLNQDRILWLNALLFAIATVFGLSLFLILANRLHRSLSELLAGTRQVEAGDLGVKLPINSEDEIGQLTHSFNQMVGQLNEKERSGTLSANISIRASLPS